MKEHKEKWPFFIFQPQTQLWCYSWNIIYSEHLRSLRSESPGSIWCFHKTSLCCSRECTLCLQLHNQDSVFAAGLEENICSQSVRSRSSSRLPPPMAWSGSLRATWSDTGEEERVNRGCVFWRGAACQLRGQVVCLVAPRLRLIPSVVRRVVGV